jgi:hypothetical protein
VGQDRVVDGMPAQPNVANGSQTPLPPEHLPVIE